MSILLRGIVASFLAGTGFVAHAQSYDEPETLEKKKPRSEGPVSSGNQALGPMTLLSPAGLLLASFDANGDYQIDTTEFAKGQATTFARIDKDKNNRLTLIEIEGWREAALGSKDARPSAMYFESNFDQVISKVEFDFAFKDIFTRVDKDEDGIVKFGDLIRVVERPSRPRRSEDEAGERRERRGPPPGRGRGRR